MNSRPRDQLVHDKVNLFRLVKRLEKSVSEDDWSDDVPRDTWIRAQETIQKIKHAKVLLKNVQADDVETTSITEQRYQGIRSSLDHLEDVVAEVNKRVAPQPRRPRPILPSLPVPVVRKTDTSPEATLLPAGDETLPVVDEKLLFSSPEVTNLPPTSTPVPANPTRLMPPISRPTTTISPSNNTAQPAFLQNSRALQDELSEQLAQMATQLRRNATYFSESLVKDKVVVDGMQEKLEGNLDVMQRARIRIRDLRGKGMSTTCFTMTSVVAVLVSFFFMIFIIRATR
ncbi:hypothetical protein SERLADRAFT_466768 [Serpula lacrymans var. lacrymans S7.9]|uniref:t-SNARE coiled-coil homology domain-containing protein n=1 Tax=Serpula lacrymans var. lacrymans (strain S7.9) TaxID=578457 RepID=F8NUR6_SERL9|nr:uncharacterized protein SERLADRAFT_466768 [Serpula lacrymans var. lacrymans S7.9]EGO25924.1 hypothetical protein SERLADRAFT_466768 [Serpula lacrymans var. lacrymans S7.9]